MRADTQRKLPGFQELTPPKYRCVSICVTRLTRSQNVIPRSLVFKRQVFKSNRLTLLYSKILVIDLSFTLSNALTNGAYRSKADA
jgi:hypothetical protein